MYLGKGKRESVAQKESNGQRNRGPAMPRLALVQEKWHRQTRENSIYTPRPHPYPCVHTHFAPRPL